MPQLSAFYGIVIRMYWRDHHPAHFHAEYGGHEAALVIADGRLLAGDLPPRALRLVRRWRTIHVEELYRAWERASQREDLGTIESLP